ncbi:FAD-binding oxidoreductase [Marinivivus vitaminiproducens]|uniref:FAD-binding oxidoreductase n=1 Tax=Marinivivus vitaminiproducens TaxID=3035935 RepID=UPI00279F9BC4|nr:FAD-binding oxidoreductase [Geminicoccaceae bacterium SCSIO 64248]
MTAAIHSLIDGLGDIPVITKPQLIRQKSRDHYWYSPILRERLEHVAADLVVCPRDEADVVAALAACYVKGVPVTARGAGTGNFGQSMPVRGGVVLDMTALDRVLEIAPGRVRVQAGAIMSDLDRACRTVSRQELRIHPSSWTSASIGGFVAGGSMGVGSVAYGLLRDPGNVLSARIVTMEATPRVLLLEGEDVQKVNHAYGTNGIITEVEMPLAPARDWEECVVAFPDLGEALRFAQGLAERVDLPKKLLSVIGAPVPERYLPGFDGLLADGPHVVLIMAAADAMAGIEACVRAAGRRFAYRLGAFERRPKPILRLYEYAWNHTVLQALKQDSSITYLQTLFPPPNHLDLIERTTARFGDEMAMHVEFIWFNGAPAALGLQLLHYTTPERVQAIIDELEAEGCPVFNPHAETLEEGGMKQIDREQLAFKREADPDGLLNPGKMLGWDDPGYDGKPRAFYLYPKRQPAALEADPPA